MKSAAKIVNNGACFERGAPGFEFCDVLGNNGFGARNFGFAGLLVLLDDFTKVVDIVKIKTVKPSCFRSDISRNGEIHYEHRAPGASGDGALQKFTREDRTGGTDGGDTKVGNTPYRLK